MNDKLESTDRALRSDYVAPVLREFGPVAALTQAGTGPSSEAMVNAGGGITCSASSQQQNDVRC